MRMGKNTVNKVTILNIISTFILQGVVFLTTPLFTRLLGSSQFGEYSLFNSWVLILTCFMGAGVHSSIGTGIYNFKERYLEFRNSILLFSILICVLEIVILFVGGKWIGQKLGYNIYIVLIIGISSFSHYITNFAQIAFTYEKRAVENFILSVTLSVVSVLLSIVLIKYADPSEKFIARVEGVSVTYFIAAIVLVVYFFKGHKNKLNSEYIRYGLVVGAPIIFHSLSQNILGQSDRVMMQLFGISNGEVGIYSLFYSLSMVLSIILGALNNSWCPFYYDDVSKEKWGEIENKSKHYIELFTVLTIGFLLLSREVSYVMGDETYWSGINVIPILVLSVYFMFMYQFPVNFEFYHKKTKIIAAGTVSSGLLNIVLNYFLIPAYGMYGAAFATTLSYFALFIAHAIIAKRMKEPFYMKYRIFIPGIIALVVTSALFYFLADIYLVRWGVGILLGVIELIRIIKRKSIF